MEICCQAVHPTIAGAERGEPFCGRIGTVFVNPGTPFSIVHAARPAAGRRCTRADEPQREEAGARSLSVQEVA